MVLADTTTDVDWIITKNEASLLFIAKNVVYYKNIINRKPCFCADSRRAFQTTFF